MRIAALTLSVLALCAVTVPARADSPFLPPAVAQRIQQQQQARIQAENAMRQQALMRQVQELRRQVELLQARDAVALTEPAPQQLAALVPAPAPATALSLPGEAEELRLVGCVNGQEIRRSNTARIVISGACD